MVTSELQHVYDTIKVYFVLVKVECIYFLGFGIVMISCCFAISTCA